MQWATGKGHNIHLWSQTRNLQLIAQSPSLQHPQGPEESQNQNYPEQKPTAYHWTENYYITSRYFSELILSDAT